MKRIMKWGGAFAVTLGSALGLASAAAQQPSCIFYKVGVKPLNVSSADGSKYVDVMKPGEIACITGSGKSGGKVWGYIAFKVVAGNKEAKVSGWAEMALLKRMSPAEVRKGVAADQAKPGDNTPGVNTPGVNTPGVNTPGDNTPGDNTLGREVVVEPAAKRSDTAATDDAPKATTSKDPPQKLSAVSEPLRFNEPIPVGPFPVNGRSIEELQKGTPLFPPLPELPEELWKKPCSTCHKWNKERLCTQGGFYLDKARHLFRHQHPYGGPYKIALMRWARSGCN